MNTDPHQHPSVDKTIVEGPDAPVQPPPRTASVQPLSGGTGAFSGKTAISPISATGIMGRPELPTGDEQVPLGSGVVVGVLGTGGMARVYKIWNEKLEVHRAVKIVLPSSQSDLKKRFETEAKITAKLRHPNIVEIYNVGEWQGMPFLEMELIEGESLEAVISRRGKLPPTVCTAVAILVARALGYAHTLKVLIYGKTYTGIIHRDLKPANVMVSRGGEVKLMDFGIARPTETSLHTVDGNIVGTLPYLAPEQIDGIDMDARVDVYAWGTIFYEMLTGAKTFPQNTITNLMKCKITNEYRAFNEFDFSIPPVIAKICQKCLEVKREDRFTSVRELLVSLEAAHKQLTDDPPDKVIQSFLADPESVKAARSGALPVWKRKAVWIPAAAAGGLLVVAGAIVLAVVSGPKAPPPKVAAAPAQSVVAPMPPSEPAPSPAPADEMRPLGGDAQQTAEPSPPKPAPTAPVAAARSAPSAPAPAKPAAPPPKPKKSPVDALKEKYKETDLVALGQAAMQKHALDDAIAALEAAPGNHPDAVKRDLMLLDAYVGKGRSREALVIINTKQYNDAQFDLSAGQLYAKLGKYAQAITCFDQSVLKPSVARSRSEIVKDALYCSAQCRSALHKADPSQDNLMAARQAWYNVKRNLTNSQSDPRYQEAVATLSKL